jgi:hypothetical protein
MTHGTAMTSIDAKLLDRQQQIWTNLYGPTVAATLTRRADDLVAHQPDLAPPEPFRLVDPDRDEDYEDFVATRW